MTSTGWTATDISPLNGHTIVITGANSGLGFESAMTLARSGAEVVLACRNHQRASDALRAVSSVATEREPSVVELDLSDLESITRASKELDSRFDKIDVLMNNAGVMALPQHSTPQGFEMQFGTNHLGHFALTGRLLPLLLRSPAPRVVTTSSQFHRLGKMRWEDLNWQSGSYRRWPAYGRSKLANLLFAFELARRAQHSSTNLRSMAAHPGYASTSLQQRGPAMAGRRLSAQVMKLGNSIAGQPASEGALPQLFAATSSDALSGGYYGPLGLGQMRGAPGEVGSSNAARSRDEAHRLWNVSEIMTGVQYDWRCDI